MYCDRSAYYQKAIKATARQLKNPHSLAVAFFAFWAINKRKTNMIIGNICVFFSAVFRCFRTKTYKPVY
jgi:hypothetical protein